MRGEFRDLSDSEPMSAAQIKKVVDHIEMLRRFEPDRIKQTTRQWLNARDKDEKYLAAARSRLQEAGYDGEKMERFPADQIILLDEVREFEVNRDEATKVATLATWEYEACMNKAAVKPGKETGLLGAFVPAYWKVRRSQGRLEQRIALLRHVEALRMYAAGHDGKLPEKLDEIAVPLPVDPFTGKAFRYAKEGETAHLRGTPPSGENSNPAYNLHYEITIRK
jgi:hypothetical protein